MCLNQWRIVLYNSTLSLDHKIEGHSHSDIDDKALTSTVKVIFFLFHQKIESYHSIWISKK